MKESCEGCHFLRNGTCNIRYAVLLDDPSRYPRCGDYREGQDATLLGQSGETKVQSEDW